MNGAGCPGMPMVCSSLPSRVSWRTEWSAIVRAPDRAVRRHVDTVRPVKIPSPQERREIAVAVEHHHRMGTAIEDVDAVALVHADRGDVAELPARRQLSPALDGPIPMLASAQNHCPALTF